MRERERGGGGRGAIHVLLIPSFFVVAFIIFFFFLYFTYSIYVFWIRYKIDVISRYAYRSVVRMRQVFDLEICSISKTLLQE